MIKQYSIGRGDDCQIKIQDNSQKVSRNHATLKVLGNGKIFITDHSSNGTFVNGVKISQSVDYPVKRGDDISFAHVANLNWDLIPRAVNKLIYYIAGVALIIGMAIVLYFVFVKPKSCPQINGNLKRDSVKVESSDSIKQKSKKAINDSLRINKKEKEKKEIKKENSGESHKSKAENNAKPDTKVPKSKGVTPAKNDTLKRIIIQ